MSNELKRLTTEYVEAEDRIRFSGELGPEAPVVLWMTQRLLYRLLPLLLDWLQTQVDNSPVLASRQATVAPASSAGVKDFIHQAAQQAAMGEVTPQPPVKAVTDSPVWLVHAVDVGRNNNGVILTFRGTGDTEKVTLPLAAKSLRAILSILQAMTRRAGWPQEVWPDWMAPPPPATPADTRAMH